MMSRTRITALLLTLCLLVGMAGMGVAEQAPITITMVHFNTEENPDAGSMSFFYGMEEFAKAYPNVTLEQEVLAHDAYETKIKTYAAADELPNVFFIKGTMVKQLVEDGQIISIDSMIDGIPGWREAIKPQSCKIYTYRDQQYSMPVTLQSNHVAYFNKKIFQEVGYDSFPTTWDDLLDLVEKLKAAGYTPIAMGNKGKWLAESCVFNTLAYRFVDGAWFDSIMNGTGAKFTDPEFIRAATAMQQLANAGAFNSDMNSLENTQARELYYSGKAACFIEGEWALSNLIGTAPQEIVENTGFGVLPAMDGEPLGDVNRSAGGPSWGWTVSSKTTDEQREVIAQLIYHIAGPDSARVIVENNAVPINNPVSYDESKPAPLFKEFLSFAEPIYFDLVFDTVLDPSVVDALYSNMQDLLIGTITPEEYAQLAQNELDDLE